MFTRPYLRLGKVRVTVLSGGFLPAKVPFSPLPQRLLSLLGPEGDSASPSAGIGKTIEGARPLPAKRS